MKALIDGPAVRICGKCNVLKLFEDFAANSACSTGRAGTCKICMNLNSQRHYEENKERKLELVNTRNRRKKRAAVELLGGRCHDCHGEFHQCVYDFHHVDGTKEMNPSKALCMSWDRAVEELNKCVLLCANCHRLRHFSGEDL